MDDPHRVCRGCKQLDAYLMNRVDELPCLTCDRLLSQAILGRFADTQSGGYHVRSFIGADGASHLAR